MACPFCDRGIVKKAATTTEKATGKCESCNGGGVHAASDAAWITDKVAVITNDITTLAKRKGR